MEQRSFSNLVSNAAFQGILVNGMASGRSSHE
jgi:hypothetical protein